MQEQLEARLAQKRSEVKSVTLKLETVQRKLNQRSSNAELANQQTTLTMTKAQHQITGYGRTVLSVTPLPRHPPPYPLPVCPPLQSFAPTSHPCFPFYPSCHRLVTCNNVGQNP